MVSPEEVIVQSVIPLLNFDSAISEVVLAENVKIRKVRAQELEEIKWNFRDTLSPIETRSFSFVLEITKRFRKSVNYIWKETEQVLTALRLLKKGNIYRQADFFRISEWEWPKLRSAIPLRVSHPFLGAEKLTLENKEVQLLKDIFCIIQKPPSQLELAIKRFEKTYEKADEEDRIIDFMIAFESLVFRGEQSEERNLPIAISISMLIGENAKERDEIRASLKEAYALRNGIVHGNMNLVKRITSKRSIKEINEEQEEYLRRSIKKLLDFK